MMLRYEDTVDPITLWKLERELKSALRPKAKTPPATILDLYLQIGMLTIDPCGLEDCDKALTRLADQLPLPMDKLLQIAIFRARHVTVMGKSAEALPPLQEALLLASLTPDQEMQRALSEQLIRLHLELGHSEEALAALERSAIPRLWADAYRAWALHLQAEHTAVGELLIDQLDQWMDAPSDQIAVVYWLIAEHLLATDAPLAAVTLAREAIAHASHASDFYVIEHAKKCLKRALKASGLPS